MSNPEATVVTSSVLRDWPLPDPGTDKESRGRVLVVGGHVETPGAVLLAAEAALRCGAGKLQVATVDQAAPLLAIAMPEALVRPLPQTPDGDIADQAAERVLDLALGCRAVVLGPGMDDPEACCELLDRVVPELTCTVVLDAIAHAYVAERADVLQRLPGGCILTPNVNELASTLGVTPEEIEKDPATATTKLARRTGAVVRCGGPSSWIAAPDGRLWRDDSGGIGLGVSGSGDVLAGTVAGLAARGADPAQAAVWGSHLHGRAGDRLTAAIGPLGYLAREVAQQLPRVLTEIQA
ncbi:MAG TPA: NAD(P)H-hydrate dehydratase [Actinomycetales bacterium]|nr:NAD(P)H-hydrate dehydratase [Actinomycetales bacterium]